MKNNVFEKDLYRYYGEKGEKLRNRVFRPDEIRYINNLGTGHFLRKVRTARQKKKREHLDGILVFVLVGLQFERSKIIL